MPSMPLLLLIAQASLPPVPPPMEVDREPSALACTFESVMRGASCAYEAQGGAGDARESSRSAAQAGQRACAAESRGDESLRKECEKAVAEASLSSTCAVANRLADAEGRLTQEALPCAQLLRETVARTSRSAALSLECCGCLAQARCAVSPPQCRRELADLSPGAALRSCLQKSCSEACSFASPARAPEPEQVAPEDSRRPNKI
jgi:hypothetical protein